MTDQSAIARTTRGGGREVRRAAREKQKAVKLPYIRRKLPITELLSLEAVEIIEANAETILEEIGVEFRRDPESLRLWREAGADVSGERVRIPRGLARHLLKTAPREFELYARNPERNVRFGGDATVFSPVAMAGLPEAASAPRISSRLRMSRTICISSFSDIARQGVSSVASITRLTTGRSTAVSRYREAS